MENFFETRFEFKNGQNGTIIEKQAVFEKNGGFSMKLHRRAIAAYFLISLSFLFLTARIIETTAKKYSAAAQSGHYKTVEIGSTRGKIYDRNLEKLVDEKEELISAFTPSVKAKQILSRLLGEERAKEIIESQKPYVGKTDEEVNTEEIRTFSVPQRYSEDSLACHLVGYVNSQSGNGVCGIEKAFNSFLKENGGKLSVSFEVDASGKVLQGLDKIINDENFDSKAGVVLTIDKRIQKIAEAALEKSTVKSGCAIVLHAGSGEILALANVPSFDRNRVEDYLDSKLSPLSNKALSAYSAGSVFKSVIAAYALESGISENRSFTCQGKMKVGDTVFTCYNQKAHGKQTLAEALQNSCNTYFIDLIEALDTDGLLMFCRSLGLSAQTVLADGLSGEKGLLPKNEELLLRGERANFSFGQGRLLVTPVQMAGVYHAIATGEYIEPGVLFGLANEDRLVRKEKAKQKKQVLSQSTVKKMRKLLSSVVEKGKAQKAKSSLLSLAGKTGTAQSGVFENGREVCRTWFSGFFPSENPHYIVVVLNEDGEGGNVDCAPVFREICEKIVFEN